MEVWRLIKDTERLKTTKEGLSVDDTLPMAVEQMGSPPVLHLYRFVPSAIVGRYQDIRAALKLDRCEELGIEFNRRSTGGGTVIMGPTVMALGFGINVDHPRLRGASVEGIFRAMSQSLIFGLSLLGVEAVFRPKNDIEVKGRKIAGLSAAMEGKRALLFHTSLLVDFNMGLLTEIMNTPLIKFQDKGYSCFSERLTTVSLELGSKVEVEEVMEAVRKGFEQTFHIAFEPSSLTVEEGHLAQRLAQERYSNPQWIFSDRHPRARMGIGRVKTKGGLLEVYVSMLGAVMEHVYITGDFFTTQGYLNQVEAALKYVRCQPDAIVEAMKPIWKDEGIYGVKPEEIMEAILLAKENQLRL